MGTTWGVSGRRFCTGGNWCYVAAFSAGDPMIGYALANFGGYPSQGTSPVLQQGVVSMPVNGSGVPNA